MNATAPLDAAAGIPCPALTPAPVPTPPADTAQRWNRRVRTHWWLMAAFPSTKHPRAVLVELERDAADDGEQLVLRVDADTLLDVDKFEAALSEAAGGSIRIMLEHAKTATERRVRFYEHLVCSFQQGACDDQEHREWRESRAQLEVRGKP